MDTSREIDDLNIPGYRFVKDGGVRFTKFGNASGGSYPGLYRYIIIEDCSKETQIISFTVSSCINGRTLFIVAIDDFESHHNSLQLSLEHFCNIENNKLYIYHDGTLTSGKKGRVSRDKVIDYMKKKSNLNICNNEISLGTLNVDGLLYASDQCVKDFLAKVTEYALLRDEIRKQEHKC